MCICIYIYIYIYTYIYIYIHDLQASAAGGQHALQQGGPRHAGLQARDQDRVGAVGEVRAIRAGHVGLDHHSCLFYVCLYGLGCCSRGLP